MRVYLRVNDPLSTRALDMVFDAGLPIKLVATICGIGYYALSKKIQRARPTRVVDATSRARGATMRCELLRAFGVMLPELLATVRARVLWFGSSAEQSARSFTQLKLYMAAATRTLDIFVYTWTSESLALYVIELSRREHDPMRVRVLVSNKSERAQGSQVQRLRDAGIEVLTRLGRVASAIAHHKFCIVDESMLLDGSFNYSKAAARDNREHVIAYPVPELIREFADKFGTELALDRAQVHEEEALRAFDGVFGSEPAVQPAHGS